MWALLKEEQEELVDVDPQQTLITDFFPLIDDGADAEPAPDLSAAQRASRKAAAWFWSLLQDFVSLKKAPSEWVEVPIDHPFIGVRQFRPTADNDVMLIPKLNLPAGAGRPVDLA